MGLERELRYMESLNQSVIYLCQTKVHGTDEKLHVTIGSTHNSICEKMESNVRRM